MRSIRAIFCVFAAGIFTVGCDGADPVQPPSKPAPYAYDCPVDPCEAPSGSDCWYMSYVGCTGTPVA